MNRREFLALSSAAAVAVHLRPRLLWAQAPQAPPQTQFEVIRGNVGYFTGRGGTIGWLVNDAGVLAVDAQFPDTAKACVDGLKQKSGRGIDLLVNTHHHGDHTGGNGIFRPETKRIVAHVRVPELQKKTAQADAPPPTVADTTFEKTWSENLGKETVRATHHGPAHTGGDAVILFEQAQVAHMGDLLFHERHPFIDRPAGASIQGWITTIETVTKELPADTIYIAGHVKEGLPVTVGRKEVLRQRDYLDAALAHVRKGLAAKQSREEITALQELRGFEGYQASPPRLTLGFVLGVAHEELTAS